MKRKNKFIISITRKACYLSNSELVDTAEHELNHVANWDEVDTNPSNPQKDHGLQWYKSYRENKVETLKIKKFKEFSNSLNPQTKFRKTYETYPSVYEDEYEEERKKVIFTKNKKK